MCEARPSAASRIAARVCWPLLQRPAELPGTGGEAVRRDGDDRPWPSNETNDRSILQTSAGRGPLTARLFLGCRVPRSEPATPHASARAGFTAAVDSTNPSSASVRIRLLLQPMDVLQLDVSGRPQAWISAARSGGAVRQRRRGLDARRRLPRAARRHPAQHRAAVAHRGAPDHRRARRHPHARLAPGAGADQPQAVRARPAGLRLLRRALPLRRADARAHRAGLARRPATAG